MSDGVSLVALVLLALFFPIGVPLILDGCGGQTWLNLLLCILGWIPGVIHAFWMINRGPKRARQGPDVIYVERDPSHPPQPQHQSNGPQVHKA